MLPIWLYLLNRDVAQLTGKSVSGEVVLASLGIWAYSASFLALALTDNTLSTAPLVIAFASLAVTFIAVGSATVVMNQALISTKRTLEYAEAPLLIIATVLMLLCLPYVQRTLNRVLAEGAVPTASL